MLKTHQDEVVNKEGIFDRLTKDAFYGIEEDRDNRAEQSRCDLIGEAPVRRQRRKCVCCGSGMEAGVELGRRSSKFKSFMGPRGTPSVRFQAKVLRVMAGGSRRILGLKRFVLLS